VPLDYGQTMLKLQKVTPNTDGLLQQIQLRIFHFYGHSGYREFS
jgi:hypothetical protein